MTKVGFVSLGCPKNLVDSEVMMGILARSGYEITAQASDADVLVVNTCSFIEPARKESVDAILEMAEYKKSGRARKLIVTGCLVERYRDEIREQIPEVDAVVGTGEIERILEACEGDLTEQSAGPPEFLYHDLTPRILATPRHTAYIKINEGCDHPCSFCIIPQLRGRFRSRRFESVVREAQNLAANGVREINLIGQDTTFYGEDLGLRDGLPLLLERLAEVNGLEWIRFLYCYPNRITTRLLETIAKHERVVKYLDIPLQHASRDVLARMKRGSNAEAFLKLLGRIRRAIPGVTLRTSFIAGFPGETEQDFRTLCDFVREAEFDWMGVFAYSDEETAKSFHCDGKVDAETIARRRSELMAIQQKISRRKLRAKAGGIFTAMLEGPSRNNEFVWEARLQGMAPEIDGKIYITDVAGISEASELPPPGSMARVEITEAQDYDLVGRATEILSRNHASPRAASIAAHPFSILA
ncbi:MAG TPA: 30S ribosomal protein S12 methylthiotransferase RimO [Candidatus Acidoferrales bacterium]|nr:30S ribosomal protein S12 methylthiotransferase RimO [Candidatus Acidoferrales bacterium]